MNPTVVAFITAVVWFVVGILSKKPEEDFAVDKVFFTFVSAFIVAILFVGWEVPEEMGWLFYDYMVKRSGLVGLVYKVIKVLYVTSGLQKCRRFKRRRI